ncbi:galactose-specific lectin nattectin-like [Salarias fasciatus]|uniref:Galactose-specific lectin nattectin-like n=1 Tax=Salarias fasciatus TaxID=181472 RepID=A0A672HIM4_SALFA|nr:galactose-specific lectin nattectin-like [Salarias fasciatus]
MMFFLFLCFLALCAAAPLEEKNMKLQRGGCPLFWYSFKDRCYRYVAADKTWADAELYCVSLGANLVSIHSEEEHNFVNWLIKSLNPEQSYTWIGLSDVHKEGAWMWSDGSRFNFAVWDVGQPDNCQRIEHCGHTNYGKLFRWNDTPCSILFRFVCASFDIMSKNSSLLLSE